MLDEYTRGFLIREIDRAQHPSGMSVHDGRVCIEASVIQRLLAVIDAQHNEALEVLRELIAARDAYNGSETTPQLRDNVTRLRRAEAAARAALENTDV